MSCSFKDLGLTESLLQAVETLNYTTPTPVQEQAIPTILSGKDTVAIAQTGTGKTAAFCLPLVQLVQNRTVNKKSRGPYVLILSPTRELAQQAHDILRTIAQSTRTRSVCITGGTRFGPQINECQRGEHVLVATPGRLLDMVARGHIKLEFVEHLVLDEADRMLDMGFWKDIKVICSKLPNRKQTLFFSATIPTAIQTTIDRITTNPTTISVSQSGEIAQTIDDFLCPVSQDQKKDLLLHILKEEKPRRALVFCRTKHLVNIVNEFLKRNRFRCAPMHSDCSQIKREKALAKFKLAHLEVLVATDVLARGIDVEAVELVINYDVPKDPENYIHRIGRSGRAGNNGLAYTFVSKEELEELFAVEFFCKRLIPTYDFKGFSFDQNRPVLQADRSIKEIKSKRRKRTVK